MQVNCEQCKAEIPPENIDHNRHLAKCAECNALFSIANQFKESYVSPPSQLLDMFTPLGLKVERLEGELKITRPWFGPEYIGLGLVFLAINACILFFAYDLGSENDMGARFYLWFYFRTYFTCPIGWIMLGLLYYVLAGFLNTTVVSVTPNQLKITHSPLPYWGHELASGSIEQLYIKERTRSRNTYSYELRMISRSGQDRALLKGLNIQEQAVYLEQEIGQFLGIEDKPMEGEFSWSETRDEVIINKSWQTLAESNNLNFTPGKLLERFRVFGNYQGYIFELMAFRKDDQMAFRKDGQKYGPPHTGLVLIRDVQIDDGHSANNEDEVEQPLTGEDVAVLFNPPQPTFSFKGKIQITKNGQKLSYEEHELITDVAYLQFLIDSFWALMDGYPKIVALGGEVVPFLQPIAVQKEYLVLSVTSQPLEKNHPLRSVAVQLLQEIAHNTTLRWREQSSHLLCKRCLVHCTALKIKVEDTKTLTYYGCRACHQSREFYSAKRVIAVLDSRLDDGPSQMGQSLRAGWLTRRTLFDFEAVEIVQVIDEDVERFAVQVGNDTDPVRQPTYGTMRCTVSSDCNLSKNSLRILKRMFGQVVIGEENSEH